jgi:fructose-1,6-bisphosphatase/inositol monophosphatase family enzyme
MTEFGPPGTHLDTVVKVTANHRGRQRINDKLRSSGFGEQAAALGAAVSACATVVKPFLGDKELGVYYKDDKTPATYADLASRTIGLMVLSEYMPNTSVHDEEGGLCEVPGSRYLVRFDPADGTKNLISGLPYVTVGMDVLDGERNVPVAAAVAHPFENELFVGEEGKETMIFKFDPDEMEITSDGVPQSVSPHMSLHEGGIVFMDGLHNANTTNRLNVLTNRLVTRYDEVNVRSNGSSISHGCNIAAGRGVLAVITAVGGDWDLVTERLVEGAGGDFRTLDTRTGDSSAQVVLAGVPSIVEEVVPLAEEIFQGYTGYK